jgi:hypothetical protein
VGTVVEGVWNGTSLTDSYVNDNISISSGGSVDSTALTDGGTIDFDWVDAEVADSLTISAGTVNNTPIGATTPSTGVFTNATSTNLFLENLLSNIASFGETATTSIDSEGDLTVGGGDIVLGSTSIFSGGDTASLNNIDAIDATTETTIETAIDTLSNLTTVGVLDSGSITSNFGTINNGASNITTTGTISGGNLVASGAAATSTIAGGLAIETSGFVYDFSTNNVGIGTASPTQALDVVGTGTFSSSIIAGTATLTGGLLTDSSGAISFGDENLTQQEH